MIESLHDGFGALAVVVRTFGELFWLIASTLVGLSVHLLGLAFYVVVIAGLVMRAVRQF